MEDAIFCQFAAHQPLISSQNIEQQATTAQTKLLHLTIEPKEHSAFQPARSARCSTFRQTSAEGRAHNARAAAGTAGAASPSNQQ